MPEHLPNGSSFNKQITYGEYLEKHKGINTKSLFNAFVMPYNMELNPFNITATAWFEQKKIKAEIFPLNPEECISKFYRTKEPL